jgi:hypothetical protein
MQKFQDMLLPLEHPLTETTVASVTLVHHLDLQLKDLHNKINRQIVMKPYALGSESFNGALLYAFGLDGRELLLKQIKENKAVLTIFWWV